MSNPALTWGVLSCWALEWDPLLDHTGFAHWAERLSKVMTTAVDNTVLWSPTTDVVIVPKSHSTAELEASMWRAVELLTGIDP